MRVLLHDIIAGLKAFIQFLSLIPNLPKALWEILVRLCRSVYRKPRKLARGGDCCSLPPSVYKRADPLIYAQYYLMDQGLAVTWDNPDIQVFKNGSAVPAHALSPDEDYDVVVTAWNNSFEGPAVGLKVVLSYLSFGIGTTSNPIGRTSIDLGVKASPNCPAFGRFRWHTPSTSGHYCLQARLDWSDDANPRNNLGQKNVQVGETRSPAEFVFPVVNPAFEDREFELLWDSYQLPKLPPCPPASSGGEKASSGRGEFDSRLQESRAHWDQALKEQGHGKLSKPDGWKVSIDPQRFMLKAKEERQVKALIEPPDGFVGSHPININAFVIHPTGDRHLVGGVTLYVRVN